MTTTTLRRWTDLVKLHPDVEPGALTEAVFAINLGAIAAKDPVAIQIEATAQNGFDPAWLRNAVEEPLDEADIERRKD